MSRETSPREASEPDQVPKEQLGTGSQVSLSPVDLIRPLEISQDTNGDNTNECPRLGQASNDSCPSQSLDMGGLITRPPIETSEEIANGFQYQPRPTRNMPHISNRHQKMPSLTSKPCAQDHSGNAQICEASDSNSHGKRRTETPLLNSPEDEMPNDMKGTQEDQPTTTASYKSLGSTARNIRRPAVNAPDPVCDRGTSNYPFPANNDTPHSGGRRHSPYHSPLHRAQFPKPISDVRRKALATISPHNRSPRSGAFSSPSTRSENGVALVAAKHDKKGASGNEQLLVVDKSLQNDNRIAEEVHAERDKRTSKRHRQVDQKRKLGLQRPMPVEVVDVDAVHSLRPCSQASNISKPRAPARKWRTPTREQNSLNLKKFAESWNTNYLYNQKLLDRWEKKMMTLEQHVEQQNIEIEQYQEAIESRDRVIDDLSTREAEFRVQNQRVQDEMTTSTNARKKLEEKLRACRSRLNDAIGEQQRLFLQCRENCQKATASIRAEGQAQKGSIEEASTAIELVRAEINQKIAAVIKDAGEQVGELNRTIRSLETQLGEREIELGHERQRAEDLRKQLAESHQLNEQSLQLAATQNQQLLEKMELDHEEAKNTEACIQKHDEKIDKILKMLEEARSTTIDPGLLMENLKGHHDDSTSRVITAVQDSTRSVQEPMLKNHESVNGSLDNIRLLCEGICERMTDAAEVVEWQERAHNADMTANINVERVQQLQDELHQMHIGNAEWYEEQQQLQNKLAELQTAATNEQTANEKVNSLIVRVEELQGMLSEKNKIIIQSSEQLEIARNESKKQNRILQEKEGQIQNEHDNHAKALEQYAQQRKQAISHAVAEATKEIEGKYHTAEKQLHEANIARTQLEKELAKSQQEIETLNEVNDREDLRRIRGEMGTVVASIAKLTTDLEESEREGEALRGSLEEWSRDRIGIDQMQHILRRLTRDQPNAIKMGDQLKELLEIQKKLSGTLEYHRAELADSESAAATDKSRQIGKTVAQPGAVSGLMDNSQNSMTRSQEDLKNLKRKVVVKSPVTEDDPVFPMSVEQERSSRRHSVPPRGIMKVATNNASKELEVDENTADTDGQMLVTPLPLPHRKIAKRGSKIPLTTYSMYNRPVAGSVLGASMAQVDRSQVGSNNLENETMTDRVIPGLDNLGSIDNSRYDAIEGDDDDGPPIKRQRTLKNGLQRGQESNTARAVKLSRSMSTNFPPQTREDYESTKEDQPESRPISLRGGPIERNRLGLMTYGSQSFEVKQSYSQSSIGFSAGKLGDSQSAATSSQTMKSSDSQN